MTAPKPKELGLPPPALARRSPPPPTLGPLHVVAAAAWRRLSWLNLDAAGLRNTIVKIGMISMMAHQPRILSLQLLTTIPLPQMKNFYHDLLGLSVLAQDADQLVIAAGQTQIIFVQAAPDQGKPFYHFAVNIPQNKLMFAREWLQERTTLLEAPLTRRDPHYPDDVRYFPAWNAHALFFYDPADNIVEFIARHNLQNDMPGPFTSPDIHCVSEIGFVVEDQQATAAQLEQDLGLEPYPPGTDNWWAMGDEQGLLLCTPRGRIWGDNTGRPKTFDVFPAEVTIRGDQPGRHSVLGYPYEIVVR